MPIETPTGLLLIYIHPSSRSIQQDSITMSVIVRPINANLTHDTEFFQRMDPYVRIYFGGQQYKTSVCKDGGRNPSWTETFTFNSATDTNLRVEVWDDDIGNDDLIGAGTFNLMKVYNCPGMRSNNEYIDLFYKGRGAGRILISFELQGMNGYWGGQGQGMGMGNQMGYNQPMNNAWSQPPMNTGYTQPPMMGGNSWGQPPMMGGNGWTQPPMNNGWGQPPMMNNPMNPMNPMGPMNPNPMNNNGWNNNGW